MCASVCDVSFLLVLFYLWFCDMIFSIVVLCVFLFLCVCDLAFSIVVLCVLLFGVFWFMFVLCEFVYVLLC